MSAEALLAWWNLVYSVPFLLAVTYLAVYATSGLTFGESDVDHDVEADVDHDLDHDVDADVDHDIDHNVDIDHGVDADADHDLDHDVDAEADHDADAEGGQTPQALVPTGQHGAVVPHADFARGSAAASLDLPFYLQALIWLGLGRAPFSIVLMVLFLTWGMIGFIVNHLISPFLPGGGMVLLASLPLAGLGSTLITRGVVALMGRWLPTSETYAEPMARLVGTSGEAVYNIDATFGLAAVRDRRGNLFQVPCRVYSHRQPIAKGQKVLLVDYDTPQRFFYVTEYELDR
jgi:hypothetical protein